MRELRGAIYGKKSEMLHPDKLLLAFKELKYALAEAKPDAPASTTPTPRAKHPAAERNIGHLPAHLPGVFDVKEPQSTMCPCGCGEMTKIGEDHTERLYVVPEKLQVIVTVRPKYAGRKCEEGVTQAPAHLIEGDAPHRRHHRPRAGVEVRQPPSSLPLRSVAKVDIPCSEVPFSTHMCLNGSEAQCAKCDAMHIEKHATDESSSTANCRRAQAAI